MEKYLRPGQITELEEIEKLIRKLPQPVHCSIPEPLPDAVYFRADYLIKLMLCALQAENGHTVLAQNEELFFDYKIFYFDYATIKMINYEKNIPISKYYIDFNAEELFCIIKLLFELTKKELEYKSITYND